MIYQEELSKIVKEQITKLNLLERVLECKDPEINMQDRIVPFAGLPPANLDTPSSKFVYWYSYWAGTLGLKTGDLDLPFDTYYWWCIKLMPGQFLPMHRDPAVMRSEGPTQRYWGMLQDYMPGHCFVYGNKLITDYQAGDMYLWDDSKAEHGAFNMIGVPRVSFQIGIGGNYSNNDERTFTRK